jgi:CspA family cold shock protein
MKIPEALKNTRILGTVKWFNKSIGFIEPDLLPNNEELPDFFIHFTNIKMEGFKILHPKKRVSFIPSEGERGPIALEIEKLDKD